jgi:general secretion pathway protein I
MEVMVALLIVSLGMLAVIQTVSQAASNSSYLRDKTIAHWVAMNRITELRLQKQAPSLGESKGDVEMVGQKWHWRTTVASTPVASVIRINVDVAPAGADEDSSSIASISGFFGTAIAPPGTLHASWQTVVPLLNGGNVGGNPNNGATPGNPNPNPNQNIGPNQNTGPNQNLGPRSNDSGSRPDSRSDSGADAQ